MRNWKKFVGFLLLLIFRQTYISAKSKPHENVVIDVSEGDDVLQAELEHICRAELQLMRLVLKIFIEISRNRAIHYFCQQHLLIWTLFTGFCEQSPAVSVVWILVTCGGCQSFHLITLNNGQNGPPKENSKFILWWVRIVVRNIATIRIGGSPENDFGKWFWKKTKPVESKKIFYC